MQGVPVVRRVFPAILRLDHCLCKQSQVKPLCFSGYTVRDTQNNFKKTPNAGIQDPFCKQITPKMFRCTTSASVKSQVGTRADLSGKIACNELFGLVTCVTARIELNPRQLMGANRDATRVCQRIPPGYNSCGQTIAFGRPAAHGLYEVIFDWRVSAC